MQFQNVMDKLMRMNYFLWQAYQDSTKERRRAQIAQGSTNFSFSLFTKSKSEDLIKTYFC